MKFRMPAAAAVLTALVVGACGCAAAPVASPTATPTFASEQEAFAAAEETYRAYVDALNQVDLSDPSTFEAVYAWTTGEANAGERETLSTMAAEGWIVEGETRVELVAAREGKDRQLDICLRVSEVDVINPSGESMVDPDRPPVHAMRITFTAEPNPEPPLIAFIEGRQDGPQCAVQ